MAPKKPKPPKTRPRRGVRTRTPAELRRTAIHEAGHAVIGRVVKQVCGGASIKPDWEEGDAGYGIIADPYVTLQHWWDVLDRYRGDEFQSIMRGRITAFMAGAEAEREFYGKCAIGDGEDRRQIAFMFDSQMHDVPDADLWRAEARLRSFTRGPVRRHRHVIERVAALLLERGTLEPEEIDAALAR